VTVVVEKTRPLRITSLEYRDPMDIITTANTLLGDLLIQLQTFLPFFQKDAELLAFFVPTLSELADPARYMIEFRVFFQTCLHQAKPPRGLTNKYRDLISDWTLSPVSFLVKSHFT